MITVRPWREHAERCVALLARVADTELVVRGSFFQRDFIFSIKGLI